MIYLSSPYTHDDAAVRKHRYEAACRAAAALMRRGEAVFSPIAHSHAICRYGLPTDWEFWKKQDMDMLRACDRVIVLTIDGWRDSVGVQAEIAAAKGAGKPIDYMSDDDVRAMYRHYDEEDERYFPDIWPPQPHVAAMLEHLMALRSLAREHDMDARVRDVLGELEKLILGS